NEIGRPGSSLYYSLMSLPAATREAANAIFALAHEIADVSRKCRDPGVAAIKFGWWREEIQRACDNAPRHPVTRVLAPVIARHRFERESLLTMVSAAESTVGYVRFETAEALHRYCRGSGG